MRRFLAAVVVFFLGFSATFADEEEKAFLQLAEGNFWQYEIIEGEKKGSGKVEVDNFGSGGRFELKLTDMGKGSPDDTTWRIEKDYIIWEYMPGLDWKILKFGAKKGDAWSSKPGKDALADVEALESKVTAVEDIETGAGSFKSCIKVETEGSGTTVRMWLAESVGIVKLEVISGEKTQTIWKLISFKVGYGISDEKLKEMVKEADAVAEITITKESAGARKATVKLAGSFKGKLEEEDGRIKIAQPPEGNEFRPPEGNKFKPFEEGDFIVFLKKKDGKLFMFYDVLEAKEQLLERLADIVTPPSKSLEKLKELAKKAQIIAGVEIVVLEDRASFKYYVAKIITAAKGAAKRKYLDVLSVTGVNLEKDKKYILFLVDTEKSGRKLVKLLDPVKGILEYDEGLIDRLAEIVKDSK